MKRAIEGADGDDHKWLPPAADLLGIPVRLVLGEKSLAAGEIELLSGDMSRAEKVSIDRSRAAVVRELESLK